VTGALVVHDHDPVAAVEERAYRGWIGIEPVEERDARVELADAMAHLAAL
jgi:hypothetical protein